MTGRTTQSPDSPTRQGDRRHSWGLAAWLAALVIAYLLALSGVSHLNNPYQFLAAIYDYRLLPGGFAKAAAFTLPFVHLALACALVVRQVPQVFLLSGGLFTLYTLAQLLAWSRGLEIDCGCFRGLQPSTETPLIGAKSIGLAAVSAGVSAVGFWSAVRARMLAAAE